MYIITYCRLGNHSYYYYSAGNNNWTSERSKAKIYHPRGAKIALAYYIKYHIDSMGDASLEEVLEVPQLYTTLCINEKVSRGL